MVLFVRLLHIFIWNPFFFFFFLVPQVPKPGPSRFMREDGPVCTTRWDESPTVDSVCVRAYLRYPWESNCRSFMCECIPVSVASVWMHHVWGGGSRTVDRVCVRACSCDWFARYSTGAFFHVLHASHSVFSNLCSLQQWIRAAISAERRSIYTKVGVLTGPRLSCVPPSASMPKPRCTW